MMNQYINIHLKYNYLLGLHNVIELPELRREIIKHLF